MTRLRHAQYAMVFRRHSPFAVGEESIEDAERSGRLKPTKMNENIAQVATVLEDDHRTSCRMIAESTGYQKTSFTTFYLMI